MVTLDGVLAQVSAWKVAQTDIARRLEMLDVDRTGQTRMDALGDTMREFE